MRERIMAKLGEDAESRIDVIHNWADGEKIRPLREGERNPFVEGHNLGGHFVLLFSGNFGLVNDFSTVLDAADILRNKYNIKFLFIGDGARKSEIEEYAKEHNLSNITLLPYQRRELLPLSLAAGHAHLVTLAEGLAGLSVPSKTYGILAVGRPIIFVGDPKSDIARIIKETGCGEMVATGESHRLAQIILDFAANPERLKQLGLEARRIFETRFDREQAVCAYLESFRRCLNHVSTICEKSSPSSSPVGYRN
jgi:glycosyltransferase involved in cell wall biosynthesis